MALSFGIVIKNKVCDTTDIPGKVARHLLDAKHRVFITDSCFGDIEAHKNCEIVKQSELVKKCDALVVFGGDGTFLSAARLMRKKSIPIIGVNMGYLGFLTPVTENEVFDTLDLFVKGRVEISERTKLGVRVVRKQKTVLDTFVINDVVLSKHPVARVISIEVTVDGVVASNPRGDGLIISSPTGSTAYNIAAGGPIVHPDVRGIIFTPICPHSLSHRPTIVNDGSIIRCRLLSGYGDVTLSLDGQEGFDLDSEDIVEVRTYTRQKLKIVMPPKKPYFDVLRDKLKYGTGK